LTGRELHDPLANEAFLAAQWAENASTAGAIAKFAARSAAGESGLAALVRERQDAARRWDELDAKMTTARSKELTKEMREQARLVQEELAAIERRAKEIDASILLAFPDFGEIAAPEPLRIDEVQSALEGNEALVLFLDTEAMESLSAETFVWIVTKTRVGWLRSELGTEALQREVEALRCGLDATAWYADSAHRCADLLKLPLDISPKDGEPLPFDAARSYALYVSLLSEARDLIKGKELLVVPAGALTRLPFQVLVTEPPRDNDLANVHWLIRDHAITVLPAVSSLKALRRMSKPSAAPNAMIGFGNPLLDGDQKDPRYGGAYKELADRARAQSGCAKEPLQLTASLRAALRRGAMLVPQDSGLADLAQIKLQTPLPETADELCEVARAVGADTSDIRIGARATEVEVKRLSASGALASYRMVHFATHGILAGQLSGTREPGLVLSPPEKATPEDDGYLSASEIAGLQLDADWVILSACNTAGGAGIGEAAEAMSGLARVFFYAGARALLVSHWEVDSAATVKLITTAIGALAKDKSLGRAEALRRAMLSVMADTSRPANWVPAAHPTVWAPFVVVGEGGR
jgi:CHAT domain-containing protein